MYTLSETTMTTRIEDETVLLDSAGGKYFGLNGIGTRMLEILLETGDIEPTIDRLILEYSVESKQLRSDLETFVEDLVQRGILVQSKAG
jgi:hypothetical protein